MRKEELLLKFIKDKYPNIMTQINKLKGQFEDYQTDYKRDLRRKSHQNYQERNFTNCETCGVKYHKKYRGSHELTFKHMKATKCLIDDDVNNEFFN